MILSWTMVPPMLYTHLRRTRLVQCHVWTGVIYEFHSNAHRRCKTFDYPLKITITRWRVCSRFMPKQKQLSAINKHCHAKFNSSGPFMRIGLDRWTVSNHFRPTHSRESGIRRWIDQVFPRIWRLTRLLPVSRLSIRSILDFHLLLRYDRNNTNFNGWWQIGESY